MVRSINMRNWVKAPRKKHSDSRIYAGSRSPAYKYLYQDKDYNALEEALANKFAANLDNVQVLLSVRDLVFELPGTFQSLIEEIKVSEGMLDFEANWDDEGAEVISEEVWVKAIKFLIDYAKFIYENYNVVIGAPVINPCNDGSIDLSWRTSKARMLINIIPEGDNDLAFYGDYYEDIEPIEGSILINGSVKEYLAFWMKDSLINDETLVEDRPNPSGLVAI